MGKASRRKRQEIQSPPNPTLPAPGAWAAPVLLAASAAGIALAAVSTWIHYQVSASGGAYTSFCNVSEAVNCDTVVTSPYGSLFGIPVSVWALLFYVVLGGVALRSRTAPPAAQSRARADALALAAGGALFSAWLAGVSIFVLETVCLLCAGLYAVAAAALVAAWKLASPVGASVGLLRQRVEIARRRPALASVVAGAVVLVLLLPAWLGAPTRMTREEVFQANPRFFDWYTSRDVVDPPTDGGHARGPQDAPIQLIEFSDFECPHCARAHVTLKDLLSRYRNEVRFVFHHFPLSRECNDTMEAAGHAHACEAAVAAECAARQDRFDPFTNLLFANQRDLEPASLRRLAAEAGLEPKAFEECLGSAEARDRVQADVAAGRRAGVRSTPTFFINGRKIEGNLEYQDWILAFALELDK